MRDLCQNRYQASGVEAAPYLPALVRSLPLNPLRAQVVPDLRTLDRSPWSGHSALRGTGPPLLASHPAPPRPVRGVPDDVPYSSSAQRAIASVLGARVTPSRRNRTAGENPRPFWSTREVRSA